MDLLALMSCSDAPALTLFGQFLVEVRQRRRKLKLTFERFENRVCTQSFACKRIVWRWRGKPSCRHGVLFTQLPADGCKCMSPVTCLEDWQHAHYMPALEPELKCIIATPFHKDSYKRLALLQAETRRLGW